MAMIELSSVEWHNEHKSYCATFSNGDVAMLESQNLRTAEQEAERLASMMDDGDRTFGEYTRFRGVREWK